MEFKDVLKDNVSVARLMKNLRIFQRKFCDGMVEGLDFTLKLEVRGTNGKLGRVRVLDDSFDHPPGGDHGKEDRSHN